MNVALGNLGLTIDWIRHSLYGTSLFYGSSDFGISTPLRYLETKFDNNLLLATLKI